METPLTPPPSFRALRVRVHPRTRTISDENRCTHASLTRTNNGSTAATRNRKDISCSPSRGRGRSRVVRDGLTMNTSNRPRPHLSLMLPLCCSPPPSRSDARSPVLDDDLIFQMSPIQPQSPTSMYFHAAHEVNVDSSRVERSTVQTLSALWEKHKPNVTPTIQRPHSPRTPYRRSRTGTVTQHQRGFSDTHVSVLPRHERRGDRRPQPSAKAILDLSSMLNPPLTPTSPPAVSEPFMYSFPSFESSPLAKARQARASREAGKAMLRGEFLTGGLESDSTDGGVDSSSNVEVESTYPQRLGPIRARKLRIQSGENLHGDVEDTDFISHAFRSASLDPEKDNDVELDELADAFEDGYYSSQRSSSVSSSSSTTDVASFEHSSSLLSSSLLASFPVRQSRTSTRSSSRSRSRERAQRMSPSRVSPEEHTSAMESRGRTSRRTSTEIQQAAAPYAGGERRSRGRTPAPARWNGAGAAWTSRS